MRIVIPEIKFHSGQRKILDSRARFKVARCGRRFGKTLLSIEWLIFQPGGAIDGAPVSVFAPEYKLLMPVYDAIETACRPFASSNKSEMTIKLATGGQIDFWTLDGKSPARGRKYKRMVVDEAAHAPELQDRWEKAISPTLTDLRGDAWFISTPKGINYFHTLCARGDDPDKPAWESFHMPSSTNPHLPSEEIERAREELPALVFAQEYLAEFVTFGAGMVKPEMCIEGACPPSLPVYIGVDLAISEKRKADYTAIVAMSRDADGRVYVREVERFRAQFNEILRRIEAAARRLNAVLVAVEENQFQAAVVQELCRTTTLPIRGVRSDKDKLTRFAPLLTRFERFMVRVDPSVPSWYRDELTAFPEGEHDDTVDASSLAFSQLDAVTTIEVRGSVPTYEDVGHGNLEHLAAMG